MQLYKKGVTGCLKYRCWPTLSCKLN